MACLLHSMYMKAGTSLIRYVYNVPVHVLLLEQAGKMLRENCRRLALEFHIKCSQAYFS